MPPAFEIYKRVYPWPAEFRLTDPVLVVEITGMRYNDFLEAINEWEEACEIARRLQEGPPELDQVLVAGMVAVAFWQQNPQMTRAKVRKAMERLSFEDIDFILDEDDDEMAEDDASPPSGTEKERSMISSASAVSPAELDGRETGADFISGETSQSDSGFPGSHNALPASLQA